MKAIPHLTWLCLTATLLLQAGCISQQKLIDTDRPEDIGYAELRDELRATNRIGFGIGGGLLSGAIGLVVGAYIGYYISYPSDKKQGCEDYCGFEGGVQGTAIGLTSGLVLGSVLGWNAGAKQDRRSAIERIRRKREIDSTENSTYTLCPSIEAELSWTCVEVGSAHRQRCQVPLTLGHATECLTPSRLPDEASSARSLVIR